MDQDLQCRLDTVAAIAVRLQAETGLPAEVLVAQWAVESQWGAKPAGQHNYFGIKRAARHMKWCSVMTRELVNGASITQIAEFAEYDSLEDSCRDFAWLITHGDPYRQAWQKYLADRNLPGLICRIATTYATDTGYAKLLLTIASQLNVAAAIAKAEQARA